MDNQLGAVTSIEYAPSTRFFLEDEDDPKTRWRTALPFPVQVVARVESADAISHGRHVSPYRYRHGYWDLSIASSVASPEWSSSTRSTSHPSPRHCRRCVPPWFHLGPVGSRAAWHELDLRDEYWDGDPPRLGARATALTTREQARSLRGSSLRREVYALDGSEREARPYVVAEEVHEVATELPPSGDRPGVYFLRLRSQRTTQWERGDDPSPAPRL